MPAEDRVVIHVSIDTDLAKDKAKIEALLQSIRSGARNADKDLNNLTKRVNGVGKSFDKSGRDTNKFTRALDKLKQAVKGSFDALGSFLGTFAKFSFIGVILELGLVGVALLSIKLALISGRLVMRAWQATLTGLGATAAGVAVTISAAAAAFRQFNEASLRPQLGSQRSTSGAVRSVLGDRQLGLFGIEGLSGALGALAQGGVTSGQTGILRKLGDFTQDPKQLQSLAQIFAQVNQTGGVSGDAVNALAGINPALVAGLAELTGIDQDKLLEAGDAGKISKEVFDALLDGQADATDAFEGQLERMSNTVIGKLKGLLPRLVNEFANLGEPFLATISMGIDDMERVVGRFLFLISGAVTGFGLDAFLPGLINAFETISEWLAKLINESMPKIDGFMDRMTGMWDAVVNWFNDLRAILAPLEQGADLLLKVLGPFFRAIFGADGFGGLVVSFNELLIRHMDDFLKWGDALGEVGKAIGKFFSIGNEAIVELLPVWTDILTIIADDIIPIFTDLFVLLKSGFAVGLLTIAKAFAGIGNALKPIIQLLTSLLNVPKLGQILGLLITLSMFSAGRSVIGGIVGGIAGLGGGAASGIAGQAGLLGAGSFGGAAMVGVGGVLGAGALGFMAGSRVEGPGGIAAGAGGGALVGAGAGFLIGGPGGAAIGAIAGGIIGGVAAWFGQKDSEKKAGMAAEAMSDAIVGALEGRIEQNLARGRGFASFEGVMDDLDEQFKDSAAIAKKYDITEEAVISSLTSRRETMLGKWENDQARLETGFGRLERATGLSRDEISELADKMGVDLRMGIENATTAIDTLFKLGIVDPFDLTKGGQNFNSEGILDNLLFGPESFFTKNLQLPETQDALDGLLDQARTFGPGELPSELARQIWQTEMLVARQKFGAEGSELLALAEQDIVKLFTDAGHRDVGLGMFADVQGGRAAILDPTGNPALVAIRALMEDTAGRLPGLTDAGREEFVASRMEIFLKSLENAPTEGLDDIISEAATFWQDQGLVTSIDALTLALNISTEAYKAAFGITDADIQNQVLAGDRQDVMDWQTAQAKAFRDDPGGPNFLEAQVLQNQLFGSGNRPAGLNLFGDVDRPANVLGTITKPMVVTVSAGAGRVPGGGGPGRPGTPSGSTKTPSQNLSQQSTTNFQSNITTVGMNQFEILRMLARELAAAERQSAQRQTGNATAPRLSGGRTGDNRFN